MAEEKAGGTPATRAKNKWNKNNYDSFLLTSIPKGRAEEWTEIAKELGYKSRNQMIVAATKISPKPQKLVENAAWVSAIPPSPVDIAPVVSTENTVRFSTTKVSINTLIIAVKPCS